MGPKFGNVGAIGMNEQNSAESVDIMENRKWYQAIGPGIITPAS